MMALGEFRKSVTMVVWGVDISMDLTDKEPMCRGPSECEIFARNDLDFQRKIVLRKLLGEVATNLMYAKPL